MDNNAIPRSILLVDDDEDDFLIIRRLFDKIPKSLFTLQWTGDTEEGRQLIEADTHDLYLIDYRLGSTTGFELLADIDVPNRRQPFIILTGAGDKKIETEAMKLGVADYLVKGKFDADLLSRVLRYSLQRKIMERQRVKELVEINESKDEFISLASHQLRTPATAVKQYVGMIIEGFVGDVTPQQRDFLEKAYASNERQLGIINDILRVARLDLNKVKIDYKAISVSDLLNEIISDLEPEYQSKQQTIVVEMPDEPVHISGDHTYLSTAINNVVDNSSKYSYPNSTVTITVTKQKDTCIIKVRDTGVGIEKADIDRLFTKFTRIPNPLSIEANGTGLGLYWSKEIISLHGGSITVTSTMNHGSEFIITLPCDSPKTPHGQ